MISQINIWLKEGKIKRQKVDDEHIGALLEYSKKDILVAKKNLDIDHETAYLLAYNSMLKSGRALMFLKGFTPDDGSQHKTTIEFCSCFIDKDLNIVDIFERMRRTRDTLNYDPYYYNSIDEEEALFAIKVAEQLVYLVSLACNAIPL